MKNIVGHSMVEEFRILCKDEIKNFEREFLVGKMES